jgi:hypothetical protein
MSIKNLGDRHMRALTGLSEAMTRKILIAKKSFSRQHRRS